MRGLPEPVGPRVRYRTAQIDTTEEAVGTKEAALILGESISTVQKRVDSGTNRSWRATGGHQRLVLSSLKEAATGRSLAPSRRQNNSPSNDPGRRPLRVLVAENNAVTSRAMAKVLAAHDARPVVSFATDAAQALLMCAEVRPDLVITDLVMEPFDRFHLIRLTRSSDRVRDVAVLVVTGLSAAEVAARGLDPDVLVYRKPISNACLAGVLDRLFRRPR